MLQKLQGEPVVVIALIGSIVVLIAQQVLASGIVTNAGELNALNLVISLVPVIISLIQRLFVTPTPAAPAA